MTEHPSILRMGVAMDLRCMCAAADCRRCYPGSAITLVPCADCGEPCPPDLDSLFPATHSTCDECNDRHADVMAARDSDEGWA